ncbi:ATP-binding protein [Gimesia panareensis]|uniref:ATP-binding protein n=1 Tax=Gimesia panareensis TaxID=2527978 RepID=UPI0011A8EAFC|nr:ATP-binding protein [Gimesia panareensis]
MYGYGKTNVVFHILKQLVPQKIPFLFLDWKRTARHLLPLFSESVEIFTPGRNLSPFPFNPLIVPSGLEKSVYLNQVVDVLASAYVLGEGAKSIVHKALIAAFKKEKASSFKTVLEAIESMQTKERATGWKLTAKRAIESVATSFESVDAESQAQFTKSLLKQNTIIELDGLSQSAKKFLIPLLCSWIYSVRIANQNREQLQFVVVFEEAHHILYRQEHRSSETLMNQLLRQGRELGIGCIVVDQHPHLISSAALGNCYTTICLNQKDPTDINKAAGLSLVHDSDKHHFSMLPVGQGIVKLQDRFRQPFLLQFPLVDVTKGVMTDSVLKEYIKNAKSFRERTFFAQDLASNSRERKTAASVDKKRFFLNDIGVENSPFQLLEDVVQFPEDGVNKRYKRLKLSAENGHAFKKKLLEMNLVTQNSVKTGKTSKLVLSPTTNAKKLLLGTEGIDGRASFQHEYWKKWYAKLFEYNGYFTQFEWLRTARGNSGKMDVLAWKASESVKSIALEIETGKSNVVSNVKRDLLEGMQKVIVVTTDEKAHQKVEQVLGAANLLIPGKVEIILRNSFDDFYALTRHVPNLQKEIFSDEIIQLLKDITQSPDEGVSARYQRLGFDTKKGNRLKKSLIENGLVESQKVQAGNNSKLLLQLTDTAKKLLSQNEKTGDVNRSKTIGSISHRKRPDRREWLAAGVPQPDICIEILQDTTDVVSKVRQDLAEGYKKVIVVVKKEREAKQVTQRLEAVRLLIPSRVIVTLEDALGKGL